MPIETDNHDVSGGYSNLDAYFNSTKGDIIELWHVLPPEESEEGRHVWYYFNALHPNEVILLKQFDSKNDGGAKRTLHSSFASPEDHGPPRQSLEV